MRNLFFILLVIIAATSFAGEIDDYYAKRKKVCDWIGIETEFDTKTPEEYAADFEKYQAEAGEGKAEAMYRLGRMYEEGRGALTSDYKEALIWYNKALEKKYPAAMNHLATLYMSAQGVEADFEKAVKLYEEAAELGNTDAMLNLGVLREKGLVFKKDGKEALKWYEKAAEKGNAAAARVAGDKYCQRWSDDRDIVKAEKYFEQAVAKGSALAMESLAELYTEYYADEIVRPPLKPKVQKAMDLYLETMKKEGGGKGMSVLISLLMEEKLTDPKLKRMAEKAAKLWAVQMWGLENVDEDEDTEEIGELDLDERDDDEKLYSFYDNRLPLLDEGVHGRDDHWTYALLYEDGETNFIKERCLPVVTVSKWLEKEAEKGKSEAMCELAYLYESDRIEVRDENGHYDSEKNTSGYRCEKAMELYTKAAELGSAEAMYRLGDIYHRKAEINLYGCEDPEPKKKQSLEDKAKSIEWYEKAAANGRKGAQEEADCLKRNKLSWEQEEEREGNKQD